MKFKIYENRIDEWFFTENSIIEKLKTLQKNIEEDYNIVCEIKNPESRVPTLELPSGLLEISKLKDYIEKKLKLSWSPSRHKSGHVSIFGRDA